MDLEFFVAGLVLDWVFWRKGVVFGDFGRGFLLLCFWFCSEFYFFPRRPRSLSLDPVCFVFKAFPQSCPFQIQELSVFTEDSYL